MKRIFLLFALLLVVCFRAPAQESGFALNKTLPLEYGKYTALTNIEAVIIGSDTVAIGGLTGEFIFALNNMSSLSDTLFLLNKTLPKLYGKRTDVENRFTQIFGTDTVTAGKITGKFVYLLNPPPEFNTAMPHTWTAEQAFKRKITADTIVTKDFRDSGKAYIKNLYVDSVKSSVVFSARAQFGMRLTADTIVTKNIQDTGKAYLKNLYVDSVKSSVVFSGSNNAFRGITTIDSLVVKTPLKTDSSDIVVKGIFTAADSTYDIGNSTNAFRDAYIDGYVYLAGNATTDGSWRFYGMLNGDLIFETRVSGTWSEKSRITK